MTRVMFVSVQLAQTAAGPNIDCEDQRAARLRGEKRVAVRMEDKVNDRRAAGALG